MMDWSPLLVFRVHAVRRMAERGITVDEVRTVLTQGKTIEDYPGDTPYPSRLVLGWVGQRPLHVVAAKTASAREIIVITVYEPDTIRWDAEFRRRRP
jgi:hypothetical protein